MGYTKVKYSASEQKLIKLIPDKPDKINSKELVSKYYGAKNAPFNAQKMIIGMIASIEKKATYNKEPWKLCRSKPAGPRASDVWIERVRSKT